MKATYEVHMNEDIDVPKLATRVAHLLRQMANALEREAEGTGCVVSNTDITFGSPFGDYIVQGELFPSSFVDTRS